jgi:hypothetical protein
LGKVLDIGLWGIFGPSPRLLFGERLWIQNFGDFKPLLEAAILGKVVDIGLLGFLAPPLCLSTSRWDLKSKRPYILETSYTKAHFTLEVRALKKLGANFEHFLLVV